jgi:phage/plasmid-associated DNA primase
MRAQILRTGELLSHAPELLLTKITGGSYIPDAAGPTRFGRFLARIQPDEGMRDFIRRLLGHSLALRR